MKGRSDRFARQTIQNFKQSTVATSDVIAGVERMCRLHDDYLDAEQVCIHKPHDIVARLARDRILTELSQLACSACVFGIWLSLFLTSAVSYTHLTLPTKA